MKGGGERASRGFVPAWGTCVAGGVVVVAIGGAGVAWCRVGVTTGTPLFVARVTRSATSEANQFEGSFPPTWASQPDPWLVKWREAAQQCAVAFLQLRPVERRGCVAVEAAAPIVGSAGVRGVDAATPVAGGAAVAVVSVAAGVAMPVAEGVGVGGLLLLVRSQLEVHQLTLLFEVCHLESLEARKRGEGLGVGMRPEDLCCVM